MRVTVGLMLILGLARAACAGDAKLPSDVQAFVERRNACDHWRGEEPYDAARQAEINRNACDFCNGTDHQLAKLKTKYKGNVTVSGALSSFESKVELPSPAALAKACRQLAASQSSPSSSGKP